MLEITEDRDQAIAGLWAAALSAFDEELQEAVGPLLTSPGLGPPTRLQH